MPTSGDRERQRATAHWCSFGVVAFCIYFVGLTSTGRAGGQDTATLTRSVVVTSDPPGATIWTRDGKTLTCTDTLTPSTIELKFHGANDIKKIRLRRFSYNSRNLDIKSTDEKVNAVLGELAPGSFLTRDDAKPEFKQLNAGIEKEFEKTILADPLAFRCAPFELNFIHVMEDKETRDLTLGVAINLDRSFGGPAFRVASHAATRDERRQKMGQAALEGGIADLLTRLHRVSNEFPTLKWISVLCSYPATEVFIDTDSIEVVTPTTTPVLRSVEVYNYSTRQFQTRLETVYEQVQVPLSLDRTEVKDKDVQNVITFFMPAAQIPDTLDMKAISDAVLAVGKINLGEGSDTSSGPHDPKP